MNLCEVSTRLQLEGATLESTVEVVRAIEEAVGVSSTKGSIRYEESKSSIVSYIVFNVPIEDRDDVAMDILVTSRDLNVASVSIRAVHGDNVKRWG